MPASTAEQLAGQGDFYGRDLELRGVFERGDRVRYRWDPTRLGTVRREVSAKTRQCPYTMIELEWDATPTSPARRAEVWVGDIELVDAACGEREVAEMSGAVVAPTAGNGSGAASDSPTCADADEFSASRWALPV